MSNPAVTFGCCLLPSMEGRSSFPLGIRARRTVADPLRVLRTWGVGLLIFGEFMRFLRFLRSDLSIKTLDRGR